MEQEHDDMTMLALDILEAGTSITEEQLDAIRGNSELRQTVNDLQDIKMAMRRSRSPIDVEQRLRQFEHAHADRQHSVHDSVSSPTRLAATAFLRPLKYILAIAAVLAGIIILFNHSGKRAAEEGTTAQGIVFTADEQQSGISLTNEKGEQMALSPATAQNETITLDDFRNIFSDPENVEHVTLNVPYGKSAAVALPDGSTVYLHPGSKVVFPTAFVGKQRVVMLEGRAYFKVAKDAEHPFIVMTDHAQTTVLGTEFDINTLSGEITLISGSIRVKATDIGEELTLKPRQQAIINPQHPSIGISEVDIVPYEYWSDGYLYFDNVELRDIMEAIGQNFNMTVEFRNTEALHYKMRFITERNNGVDAAIDMMNRMKKAHIRRSGDKIIVE